MSDFKMGLTPVEEVPDEKEDEIIAKATWIPEDDELAIIKRAWRDGGYAGNCACSKCGNMAYCYGKTYEKKICLPCFTETKRPKRKYTKRKTS